jgi:hypothetical protein
MQQPPFGPCNLLYLVFQSGLESKESICVDGQWHIEHCPPNFVIQCFTFQKTIALKCKTRINFYKFVHGTLAPRYLGLWVEYHNGSLKHHKHWFSTNDFNHCVGGTTWNFAIARPFVPSVWPIQEGTNLIQKEVTTLKEASFSFDYLCKNNAQIFFGSQSFSLSNSHVPMVSCHNLVKLFDASCSSTTCGGKKVKHPLIFKLTQQHTNNWEVGKFLL